MYTDFRGAVHPVFSIPLPTHLGESLSVAQRFISPAWTPEQLNTLLSFSDELHDKIYIRRLHCTKKESAARLMQKEINIWEKGFYNEN